MHFDDGDDDYSDDDYDEHGDHDSNGIDYDDYNHDHDQVIMHLLRHNFVNNCFVSSILRILNSGVDIRNAN